MALLAPWMILLLGAIAVPVWVHLVKQPYQSGKPVASVMFLRAHVLRVRQRQKLRDLALLALRILIIALAAFALSQPIWSGADRVAAEPSIPQVILLDQSASMQVGERWQQAKAQAQQVAREARAQNRDVALVTFAGSAQQVSQFSHDLDEFNRALNSARILAEPGQLEAGLSLASELLRSEQAGHGDVVVVSDLQRSSVTVPDANLPANLKLDVRKVGTEQVANAAIHRLSLSERRDRLQVEVKNNGDVAVPASTLTLTVDGHVTAEQSTSLAIGETRLVEFPLVGSADRTLLVMASLEPDGFNYDNRAALVLPPVRPLQVAVLRDYTLYPQVQLALVSTPDLRVQVETPSRAEVERSPNGLRALADVLIAGEGLASIHPEAGNLVQRKLPVVETNSTTSESLTPIGLTRNRVEDYLRGGGALVVNGQWPSALATAPAATDAATSGSQPATTAEQGGTQRRLSGTLWLAPTGTSAVLQSIADALRSVPMYAGEALDVATGEQVLLRWSTGDAAAVWRPVGAGGVLRTGFSVAASDGQLGQSPVLAPLVQILLRFVSGISNVQLSVGSGEEVLIPGSASAKTSQTVDAGGWLIVGPDGQQQRVPDGQALFASTTPGLHVVQAENAPESEAPWRYWVKHDNAESELQQTDAEAFLRTLRVQPDTATTASSRSATEQQPQDSSLWWYIMAFVLLLTLSEMLVSSIWSTAHLEREAST